MMYKITLIRAGNSSGKNDVGMNVEVSSKQIGNPQSLNPLRLTSAVNLRYIAEEFKKKYGFELSKEGITSDSYFKAEPLA